VRDVLVRFARDVELPRFTRRIENVRRLLFIGSCLGAPLVDAVRSTVAETHVAVVASGCSGGPEGVTTAHPSVTVAGTLDRIWLPTGWAECIVGHCVLDELPTPLTAFTELARAAASGASICLSGPASAGASPTCPAGIRFTVWPVHQLIQCLYENGFTDVSSTDWTPEILRRLPEASLAHFGLSPEARWIALEGRRARGKYPLR
jgi:hypothetical protein